MLLSGNSGPELDGPQGGRSRTVSAGLGLLFSVLLLLSVISCGGSPSGNSAAAPAPTPNPQAAGPSAPTGDEFTIIALPDTQYYSRDFPDIFRAQTQWIADHVQDQNIKLVLGLGDIVDNGADPAQWQNADSAVRTLDGRVPYMMAIGNHDYANARPAGRTANALSFNQFFGPARYASAAWYRGSYPRGSNENFYGVVNISGRDFLVLVIEFDARDSALAWADGILKANQDKDAIIVTHSFTFTDNTRLSHCDPNSAASFGVGADNDGEDMWWKLVRKYPNVRMVLSGHVNTGDGTGHRVDLGDGGNLVNQMLSDYQSEAMGGGGFLRILKISLSQNRISVTTYSPWLNSFKTDDHNQFTVPYVAQGGGATPGTVYGRVKDIVTCAAVPGVSVAYSGGSAVTDAEGNFSMPALATRTIPITTTASGLVSDSRTATATADPAQPSPTKIFVSTAGRVTGYIRTAAGAAIPGATLNFIGGDLRFSSTVTTDGNGFYDSGPIAIGSYSVLASASGYTGARATTSVTAGSSQTLDMSLK
ncbi:MAG TPA: carboxypeptidase regulatory-like domain-containing protein [Candidatus Limnocylindrales bacterium]|nr:carboxypeptidase regulatory-like domain-containing protein [Candidatus Limnocylindrales bacterium]